MAVKLHYAILTAYRPSTDTRVQRFLTFSGSKLEGLAQRMNDFDEQMGPCWDINGEITSREYFEMRIEVMRKQENQWSARLR